MSKIICDICGTTYPETAEQCPICGSARDMSADYLSDELLDEEVSGSRSRGRGGRFASSNVRKRRSAPRYEVEPEDDDDEYDEDEDDEDEDDYDSEYEDDDDDDDYDDDDEPRSNTPLVIFLVVVIVALLVTTAYIGVKFFLPNVLPQETTVPTTTAAVETNAPVVTTEPTIPCESLSLTSGSDVLLEQEGQMWLINVLALPENTTDKLTYVSSDESVVTVGEDGTLTAVGEGTASITITCGEQQLVCNVTCAFAAETTAPEETTVPEETTEPTEPTEALKDITLRVIYWSDLTFDGPNQGFTFVLDGLTNEEVKWSSEDENIVTVDEKGFVVSVGPGKTNIICEYGDQKIEIPVNCRWGG